MSADQSTPDASQRSRRPPVRPPVRRRGQSTVAHGMAAGLALVVCSWVSLMMVRAAGSDEPSAANWQSAADYVRAERAKNDLEGSDLIVFAPRWIDPLGRQYLGDQMSIEMAARMDASRYERIWELSVSGARAPETVGLPSEQNKSFGPLRLRLLKQRPAEVTEDFTSNWKRAEVSGQMQGRPNLGLQEVGFEPHLCVKVVPRPNKSASMRYESVLLGSEIVAYVGLADVFTRRDIRDPGELEILVDGKSVASARVTVDNGWQRVVAATSPGNANVEFRFRAVGKGARDRRICFAAEARR